MADHADQVDQHALAQHSAQAVQLESEKKRELYKKEEEKLGDPSTFKTYNGHCHCGKFRFKITHPELKKLNECNCSICFVVSILSS